MTSQIHLENFVESSATLPAELVRPLATIKDLDERSQSTSVSCLCILQSFYDRSIMADHCATRQSQGSWRTYILRCAELLERIENNVEDCLERPAQANAANRKSGNESANEVCDALLLL